MKHQHTRTHTRAILTKRFRWVGFFVKFVRSRRRRRRRRESLSALALCVCLRHLQLHSEQSWPRFWCRKLFRSSSSLLPSVQSALHKSNGIFFLCFARCSPRVFVLQVFHTHTHANTHTIPSVNKALLLLLATARAKLSGFLSTYCNLCGSETGTHCAFYIVSLFLSPIQIAGVSTC